MNEPAARQHGRRDRPAVRGLGTGQRRLGQRPQQITERRAVHAGRQRRAYAANGLGWRSISTAIIVTAWVGQRVSDLLAAPPIPAEGPWVIRQSKTGRTVALPAATVPEIVARLAAAGQGKERLLVHDRHGGPWTIYAFDDAFAAVRQAAAATMPSCARLLFRELRHYAATRLHEAGVDAIGIAAITGHSEQTVRQVLERHYLVRTVRAAEAAFARRVAAENAP